MAPWTAPASSQRSIRRAHAHEEAVQWMRTRAVPFSDANALMR